ncbi:MAG: AAA family ATPase [Legionella sp.]|nr:AAA family ATPase [Legionella sp.]
MKILELRFKNLNSLYGEWLIDFSTPEFISNGIFAITGPTGAGKSTILDAICLALYGATPRLGKLTKSSNQLMSQQTAECYAEVTFESQQGKFTCHWSQHKARRKTDGILGESKHEIIDALTGQILESKKRDVANVIEEKTGMDFERFTRSILLAQGGFAAFLMATPDERAPILEQITGTEIYSEISKRVHEKTREERDKLNLMQAELSGIVLLSDEQEKIYQAEILEKKGQEEGLINETQKLSIAINWLTTIEMLNKEIAELTKEYETLNRDWEAFSADRNRLAQANKAMELDGPYATLKEYRKQHTSDKQALSNEDLKIPEMKSAIESQKEHLINAEQKLTDIKSKQKIMSEIFKKVRHKDQQLIDKKKIIEEYQRDIEKYSAEIASRNDELNEKKELIHLLKQKQKVAGDYIEEHAEDAELISQLTGIEEQLKGLVTLQTSLTEINNTIKILNEKLKDDQNGLEQYIQQETEHQTKLSGIRNQTALISDNLSQLLGDRILREYRTEKDNLLREMAYLQKIASLESERQKLENDKPCPLCGSKIHPYAENNIPQLHETEIKIESLSQLINKAEDFEQEIREIKTLQDDIQQKISSITQLKSNALHEKNQSEKELQRCEKQISQLTAELNLFEQAALKRLKKFSIKEISYSNTEQILIDLNLRLTNWNIKQEERATIERDFTQINNEINPLEAIIATLKLSLSEKQTSFENINKEYSEINEQRTKLFGIKQPDEEEAIIEQELQEAERTKSIVQKELDSFARNFEATQTKIQTLRDQISEREPQLCELEISFKSALKNLNFDDETNFISFCLRPEQRNSLAEQAKILDNKKTSLETKITDRRERLVAEKDKMVTESNLSELIPRLETSNNSLNKIRERITTLSLELKKHNDNKKQFEIKRTLIDKQKCECGRMDVYSGAK